MIILLFIFIFLDYVLSNYGTYIIFLFNKLHQLKLKLLKIKQTNIVVTGSYGKTTTCNLIYHMLKNYYPTKLIKHNSQIGIPLSLLGIDVEKWKKIKNKKYKWYSLYFKLFYNLLNYYPNEKINVIEVGIDKKNDMTQQLINLPPYCISIITEIDYVHYCNFNSIEEIVEEKFKLIENTMKNGIIICNLDNPYIFSYIQFINFKNKCGISKKKNKYFFHIKKVNSNLSNFTMKYRINNLEKEISLFNNKYLIPEYFSYNLAYAIIVADYLNIPVNNFNNFEITQGRNNLIKGINNNIVIDSSYNSSFKPLSKMITTISKLDYYRRIFIIGDMLELGKIEKDLHLKIFNLIEKKDVYQIIFIGTLFKKYTKELSKKNNYLYFDTSEDLINHNILNKIYNSLIFVKGSNSIRLNKIVKYLSINNYE